ncbi:MAG: hypothetical protein ACUVV0_10010 [Anaerolineae bacterium]
MSEAERAEEIAALLVRVYEIHETVIAESGGLPGLREASMLHAVEVAEEALRYTEGESIQPKSIAEIADWFRKLLGEMDDNLSSD